MSDPEQHTTHQQFFADYDPSLGDVVRDVQARARADRLSDSTLIESLILLEDRFTNLEPLTQGGRKSILRAIDRATGLPVALATLPPDADPVVLHSFVREARVTAALQHPCIPTILALGILADGRACYAMPLLIGKPLSAALESVTREQLRASFLQIVDAVANAHNSGVIHLDISPDNVFICENHRAYLLDWGLAKVMDESCDNPTLATCSLDHMAIAHQTCRGFVKGTPGFMAPEQVAANASSIKDERTDVFALGALLYTILCGRPPIDETELSKYASAVRRGQFRPMAAEIAKDPWASIAAKALSVERTARYANAADMQQALQTPAAASPKHARYPLLLAFLAGITLATTVVSGSLLAGSRVPAPPPRGKTEPLAASPPALPFAWNQVISVSAYCAFLNQQNAAWRVDEAGMMAPAHGPPYLRLGEQVLLQDTFAPMIGRDAHPIRVTHDAAQAFAAHLKGLLPESPLHGEHGRTSDAAMRPFRVSKPTPTDPRRGAVRPKP